MLLTYLLSNDGVDTPDLQPHYLTPDLAGLIAAHTVLRFFVRIT